MHTKVLLLASVLATVPLLSQAQTSPVQFGLKGGLTRAVLSGTINQETDFKTGWHFGGFLRFRPETWVAIQPELVLSQQGVANSYLVGNGITLKSKTNLSYLNLPILCKVYIGNVFNIQFGPQFGLLLAAREKGQTSYTSSSTGGNYYTESTVDVKSDYKGDVGLCGGLGVDLKNGFIAAARLNYGLSNINNNNAEQQVRDRFGFGGLHNRAMEFSVGYAFGSK